MASEWSKWTIAIACLIAGALCGAACAYFLKTRNTQPSGFWATGIYFPVRIYTDLGTLVYTRGRIVGAGYPDNNNEAFVRCERQTGECSINVETDLGNRLIDDEPYWFSVTNWDKDSISANDAPNPNGPCAKNTININRRNGLTEWVQEPINQSQMACLHSANATYKWTLEKVLWEVGGSPQ